VSLEPATGGVRVKEVVKDSPAAQAGIQAGDVIVSIDGHATADVGSLQRRLAYRWAGEEVEVGFRRQGELESAAIVLMPRPTSE
jgi:S1-C subfamily serine protease